MHQVEVMCDSAAAHWTLLAFFFLASNSEFQKRCST